MDSKDRTLLAPNAGLVGTETILDEGAKSVGDGQRGEGDEPLSRPSPQRHRGHGGMQQDNSAETSSARDFILCALRASVVK